MSIQAAEISAILKDQIKNFGQEAEVAEVGRVLSLLLDLRHENSVDLVDTNQVCTNIVEENNHIKHKPALTYLFVGK